MPVLLDCRPLQYIGSDSEKSRLVISTAAALARDRGIKWLFLVDHTYEPGLFPGLPDMPMLIRRAFPARAGWKLWYDWQIPGIVRKFRCNAVVMTGGVTAGIPDLPQFLWMPVGVDPKTLRGGKQELPLYVGRLAASLQHAEAIFCFSESDRVWLSGLTEKEKIFVMRPAFSSMAVPLTIEERERTKREYAGGREYFFVDVMAASEEEVIQLLKAYSLFKKRQLSNLRLVLSGHRTPGLSERLKQYRYGDEVFFLEPGAVEDRVLDGAYAALFPFEGDSLGQSLAQAWQAGVPALIRSDGRLRELAGEAALGVLDDDPGSLAVRMMSIYKDESLRASLIEKGFEKAGAMDSDPGRQLAEVWNVISRICMV